MFASSCDAGNETETLDKKSLSRAVVLTGGLLIASCRGDCLFGNVMVFDFDVSLTKSLSNLVV